MAGEIAIFQWLTAAFIGIASIAVGVIIYLLKNAKESGTTEGSTAGRVDMNSTLITNAIKEVEKLKEEMRRLCASIQDSRLDVARVQESMKYIKERIDSLQKALTEYIESERERHERRDRQYNYDSNRDRRDNNNR